MTDQEISDQQNAVLNEDKPILVTLHNGKVMQVRVLNMDDLLDPAVIDDMSEIFKQVMFIMEQDKKPQAPEQPAGAELAPLDQIGLMVQALKRAIPATRRLLIRVMSEPLKEVSYDKMPEVLTAFATQNFSVARLRPWGDLFRVLQSTRPASSESNTTSGTSSRPLSPEAIPAGAAIPATNSSSGSGGA